MTTDSSDFLSALTFALTERGWTPENVVDIKVNLLTGSSGPRFADFASPDDDLRIATRSHLGKISADLFCAGTVYLTVAGGVSAALAAIDAAHAWLRSAEADELDESTVSELLEAAGWTWSLDAACRHGEERTFYSPDGRRRVRNSLEFFPATSWILAQAPEFADSILWTGEDESEAPAAVIVAVALAADDTLDRA